MGKTNLHPIGCIPEHVKRANNRSLPFRKLNKKRRPPEKVTASVGALLSQRGWGGPTWLSKLAKVIRDLLQEARLHGKHHSRASLSLGGLIADGQRHPPADDSTGEWEGCSLSWNLPLPPKLFSYDDPTRPSHWQQLGKPAVYVNVLLIVLAILVVIFSIWGLHQLK